MEYQVLLNWITAGLHKVESSEKRQALEGDKERKEYCEIIYSNSMKTSPGLNLDIRDELVKVFREVVVSLSLLVTIKRLILYILKLKVLETVKIWEFTEWCDRQQTNWRRTSVKRKLTGYTVLLNRLYDGFICAKTTGMRYLRQHW